MSIKVYNGFRVRSDSLCLLNSIMDDLRPLVAARAELLMQDTMRNLTAAALTPDADIILMWMNMREQSRIKRIRLPQVDTDFTVTCFSDPVKRYTYGIVFCEHAEWISLFMEHPLVEEYSYWNNTDPMEGVSSEDWLQRGLDWEPFVDEAPVVKGFTFELVHPDGPNPFSLNV